VIAEWRFAALADDAALLVSELVTNAVAASADLDRRPPIGLRLSAGDGRVVIEVWDYSPADVETLTAADDAECGRGMVIVDAVAHRWGQSRRGFNRKVVWAVLEP
jgi:anti-sigma regulatory factor (Ser/Thr protein kinase)